MSKVFSGLDLYTKSRSALSAVVCGATQHGVQQILLGRPTSTHIIPTKSYGFIIDRYSEEEQHGHSDYDATKDHSLKAMVRDRIEWVAKKASTWIGRQSPLNERLQHELCLIIYD